MDVMVHILFNELKLYIEKYSPISMGEKNMYQPSQKNKNMAFQTLQILNYK
jgi:hypothetical protein